MLFSPITYDEPVFRPPSEAYSLIIQLTIGCSWNKCAFCEMYTSKKFRIRPINEIFAEIDKTAEIYPDVKKVFLADGNAMVLSTAKLLKVIEYLNKKFPRLTRISAYAIPKDLENKTVLELKQLLEVGLKLIYVGIETGDDELLQMINKGETSLSTIKSMQKVRESGIKSSVMIINGLGGRQYSQQHAENSAKVVNAIQPEFLSTLVLSFPFGMEHFKSRFHGEFFPLNILGLLKEQKRFLLIAQLHETVFRSDHASNYLVLKGMLGRDKERMLNEIDKAISHPDHANLREEWQRGL
ncbi:MAG: radical SAM protein [Bacteroidales bacterium]|nr:radical SAM protein [Bacteroidales bacterium]